MNKQLAAKKIVNEYEGGLRNVNFQLDYSSCGRTMKHYLESYCSLLDVSRCLCKKANTDPNFQIQATVAIAHMAYGWMRTTLKNCDVNTEEGKAILKAIDIDGCQNAIDFIGNFQSSPINNSCIGLSKVLHFINPEFFPIWDSKVATNFGMRSGGINIEKYVCYIEFCYSILNTDIGKNAVGMVRDAFLNNVGYDVSNIRALEFILFVTDRQCQAKEIENTGIQTNN